MALQSRQIERISAESLAGEWVNVGSGGFGCVYKARHKDWKFDVAIKQIKHNVSSFIKEVNIMELIQCPFVLRVYGILEGCPPGMFIQNGIVMEYMNRGSVETLQEALSGPPPWPLAFRLAHEVALGMNFLHSKKLVHSDLKPSNVLLDDDFHAKIADFGLSMISNSALNSSRDTTEDVGGSYKYTPPEAFDSSYRPVRSFDRYSYGILLWSLFTGKEPYEGKCFSVVALCIPRGDRPDLEEIDQSKAEGLAELVDLMRECWDKEPSKRPTFQICCERTDAALSKHRSGISNAVTEVLTRLDSKSPQTPEQSGSHDSVDHIPPRHSQQVSQGFSPLTPEQSGSRDSVNHFTPRHSQQDSGRVPTKKMTDADKAKFVDKNKAQLIQDVSEVMAIVEELGAMVHKEAYSVIKTTPTSQDKMRELYDRSFRSGGEEVKAAFYDILKRAHPNLVKRLGGEL